MSLSTTVIIFVLGMFVGFVVFRIWEIFSKRNVQANGEIIVGDPEGPYIRFTESDLRLMDKAESFTFRVVRKKI